MLDVFGFRVEFDVSFWVEFDVSWSWIWCFVKCFCLMDLLPLFGCSIICHWCLLYLAFKLNWMFRKMFLLNEFAPLDLTDHSQFVWVLCFIFLCMFWGIYWAFIFSLRRQSCIVFNCKVCFRLFRQVFLLHFWSFAASCHSSVQHYFWSVPLSSSLICCLPQSSKPP